jgi:hypothetical protein
VALDHGIGVRIPASQPTAFASPPALAGFGAIDTQYEIDVKTEAKADAAP